MKTIPYTGTVAGMKTSPWLASEDILGLKSPELVIEDVFRNEDVVMDGGRIEPVLFSLKFVGANKQMILNSTNRRALTTQFGADTKQWRGKTVTLYVDTSVKMKGKVVNGLRIKTPTALARVPVFTPPNPEEEDHIPMDDPPPFSLDPTPPTALDTLRDRIATDKLKADKVEGWLSKNSFPDLDKLMPSEAAEILENYDSLKKEAK